MWVFLFSFQAYQLSVFVTCVKASYMFNKANYLVNYIQEGIFNIYHRFNMLNL